MALGARTLRVLQSSGGTVLARVVTVACSFVAMPLCAHYLGVAGFGVWAAIVSTVALLAFADFGIGNGVLNLLSAAFGRDDDLAVRRIAATALALLGSLGLMLFGLFAVLMPQVDWSSVFGAQERIEPDAVQWAVFVLAAAVALNMPTGILQRMQFALQRGHLNGAAQAAGGVLTLLLMLAVSRTQLGLAGMVGAALFGPLITLWASVAWMFGRAPGYRPRARDFDAGAVRPIVLSGSKFLVLGVVFCLCQMSDSVIVASVLGAEQAATFAVHQKYFSPVAFIGAMVLTPLWAAYAEAAARGEHRWVWRAFAGSSMVLAGAAFAIGALLLWALTPAVQWWMKGRIGPDAVLALALMVWVSVELLGKAVSTFLHAADLVSAQVKTALVFLPVCLTAKIVGAQQWGVAGVVWGTTLAYVAVHAWPYARLVQAWRQRHLGAAHPPTPS
jgi:O-antigen/teichoic acid export membrane protein